MDTKNCPSRELKHILLCSQALSFNFFYWSSGAFFWKEENTVVTLGRTVYSILEDPSSVRTTF